MATAPQIASKDFTCLRYAVADGIALVTLNRPERRNALNPRAYAEVEAAFRAAAADAGSKQLAAVPWLAETEVGLELLGLDDQQIKRALADRRRNGGTAALAAIRAAVEANQPVVSNASPAGR